MLVDCIIPRSPWQQLPTGALGALLVGEPTDFTMQFQLYTFQVDFPNQQQAECQVVI